MTCCSDCCLFDIFGDMMKDLISIIIPVYNVAPFLDICLQSVRRQTYNNIEVILVDDGSTDASGRICDNYCDLDKRFSVIHKENEGQSQARNEGLKRARGNFVGFVDADDCVDLKMYERMIQVLQCYEADIAVCRYDTIDEDVEFISSGYRKKSRVLLTDSSHLLHDFFCQNWKIEGPNVWKRLYRKHVLQGVFFPDGKYDEDTYVSCKALMRAGRCAVVDEVLYHYRDRQGSISNNARVLDMNDMIDSFDILTRLFDEIDEKGYGQIGRIARETKFHGTLNWYERDYDLVEDDKRAYVVSYLKNLWEKMGFRGRFLLHWRMFLPGFRLWIIMNGK